ncbi:MAG: hypothetical protein EB139_03075 [Burkholderiaceae bacterium]|nr:hypothetical protein [Burkholderiaceae bacterium]
MDRRHFLGVSSAASLGVLAGCASPPVNISKANVVVVGGGYGGATAAKYVRMFSNNTAQVTLIEPNAEFISCPMSNLVVGGHTTIANISTPYDNKPKSKVLILDANDDVVSKGGLFKKAWASMYAGMIEYRPKHNVVEVDSKTKTLKFDVQNDVKADVLNVLPLMRAGDIAVRTGIANSNARWVNVNYINFESTAAKDIHVLGDSIQIAPLMPKSGHMANSHAKVAAAAIVAELGGFEVNQNPVLTNTCYSFVSADEVVHVASVHQYDAKDKTFKTVPGSGGLSAEASKLEGVYAWGWARNIWADSLG